MRPVVLACGTAPPRMPGVDPDRIVRVSRRPGKSEVDAVLAKAAALAGPDDGGEVIVVGTDADLAAVALRLLRRDRLSVTGVGYLPTDKGSAFAALWGLPSDPDQAFRLAVSGAVHPVPLLRDDVGGVLVGSGVITGVNGIAYCDDEVALHGFARRIEVEPDTDGHRPGLVVRVHEGRIRKRVNTFHGRAFSLGCDPVGPVLDGVRRDHLIERWTWYRHTEDLRLVR